MQNKRAYLLSLWNGTVQIGDTVFQPCTGARFQVDRKGLKSRPWIILTDKSMRSARLAIENLIGMDW